MLLLDTNVISEFRKISKGKADPHFVAWQREILPSLFYISAISMMEIELGILKIQRKDHTQGEVLRKWLEYKVIPAFDSRILNIDVSVARVCANLHVPDPRSERDALIAATAITNGMSLVTRNTKDFKDMGLNLINPWE